MLSDEFNPKIGDKQYTNTDKVFVYRPVWKCLIYLGNDIEYNKCIEQGIKTIPDKENFDYPQGTIVLYKRTLFMLSGFWCKQLYSTKD